MKKRRPGTIVVCLTCAGAGEAARIAGTLVRERLAACVNSWPVNSVYRWRGKMVKDKEHILLIKSLKSRWPELAARIKKLHSYEIPAIFHWRTGTEKCFGRWVEEEVNKK